MTINAAIVVDDGTVTVQPVSTRNLNKILGGWTDHEHFDNGLVMAYAMSRDNVEGELQASAEWYTPSPTGPVVFMRSSNAGGFASINDNDLQLIQSIVK